ncbi:hypothetical protein pb186bvf_007238 [Paramecium bursaria]
MNVEEGYYYFISGKDRALDEFRKIQPFQPINFWKDIYYYPFQKCQNFLRLTDLFGKDQEYKLDILQIQFQIINTAQNIYNKTKIVPNMKLRYIFLQYDTREAQSQLCKISEKQFLVIFVKPSKQKSFKEAKDMFEIKFDELISSYSQYWYLLQHKKKKNNGNIIGDCLYKLVDILKQNQKSQKYQSYLIRNIQDYIKCQNNPIDIERISTLMETINNQHIQWLNFEVNFFKINNIKKIITKPLPINDLQQLQQYCIVVDAINKNFNIYNEIILYVTQVKSYLALKDEILDIEDLAIQLMNQLIVPQLRTNTSTQSFLQIIQYNQRIVKQHVYEYIEKKVNKL